VIAIAAGVIAPIIAAAVFGERIGIVAALLGFEGRLPDLVGVADRYTLFVIRLTKII